MVSLRVDNKCLQQEV